MRGISINDFVVAMETYGATRVENTLGYEYTSAPCFVVGNGVTLMHSGLYYAIQRNNKASKEIMDQAMAVFGEKYPGGNNFWWGNIISIPGLLTLASMLDGKYSKELVDQLTNEVYKKLLDNPEIKSNEKIVFTDTNSSKMKLLKELISEYDSVINPFGNPQLRFKDPIEYLDTITPVIISKPDSPSKKTCINLFTKKIDIRLLKDNTGFAYQSTIFMQKDYGRKILTINHYYNNEKKVHDPNDEVIMVDYYGVNKKRIITSHPDDFSIRISLKTGLAWEDNDESLIAPVTDEELDFVISLLKLSVQKIKNKILNKMII